MRLLNTETLQLTEFFEEPFPKYAILSHRWGNEEVSFQELQAGLGTMKEGYRKIEEFCRLARRRGFARCWVDTCGIDKTSSAELSEAINSMFKWYEYSGLCIAYLSDVTTVVGPDGSLRFPAFESSSWFTRGWTLQELIAPRSLEFYSFDWKLIGDKRSMVEQIAAITRVDKNILNGNWPLLSRSIAKKLSWASHRVTTRKEDIAYCLLGLFNIHMPLLYGEGARAFIRLQEEILKQYSDQSLFAWNPLPVLPSAAPSTGKLHCGILAPSPACFAETGSTIPLKAYWNTETALTNRGIRICMPFHHEVSSGTLIGMLCCVDMSTKQGVAIELLNKSDSLEDLDHLIRLATPLRYLNWDEIPQVQFNTVYLATEASLEPARLFGREFYKPEPEIYLLLHDPHNFTIVDDNLTSYPSGALVEQPSLIESTDVRVIAVVNPLRANNKLVALLLPTKLSCNIALVLGFKPSNDGSPDFARPWKYLEALSEDDTLEGAQKNAVLARNHLDNRKEASKLTIDEVDIDVAFGEARWWALKTRSARISLILPPK